MEEIKTEKANGENQMEKTKWRNWNGKFIKGLTQ